MDFIKIPYDALLSKDYARERRKLIAPQQASLELRPGSPQPRTSDQPERQVHVNLEGESDHEGDTSYIALVDKDRNMVSFEPSLHSGFGTGVVMGNTGIIFNCRGDYYSLIAGEANALEPGKRPRSTLQSTLVMKDGQPFMTPDVIAGRIRRAPRIDRQRRPAPAARRTRRRCGRREWSLARTASAYPSDRGTGCLS